MAERLALRHLPQAFGHAARREAGGQGGDRHPPLVQYLQELGVAPAALPSRWPAGTRQDANASSRVSEAHQPTLEYSRPTVKPGVPAGTMMAEISGLSPTARPPARPPVRASTVTSEVMAVPAVGDEGLRSVDDPLPTRLPIPFTSRAVVRMPPGMSDPAAGLGQPERGQPLARAQLGQPPLPLLLGAEPVDRHGAQRHRRPPV